MARARKKRWNELSPRARGGIVAASLVQLALQAAALRDLRRRPAAAINGSKRLWFGLSFVNFAGPIAYFALGRRDA